MGRRLLSLLRVMLNLDPDGTRRQRGWSLLERELLERGYSPDEVAVARDVIDRIRRRIGASVGSEAIMEQVATSSREERSVQVLTLSEKSFNFLNSLKDLGLVDEEMEEEILNRLMISSEGEISLEAMKQTSAIVIFERQFDANEDYYGIFEEEWKLLFN